MSAVDRRNPYGVRIGQIWADAGPRNAAYRGRVRYLKVMDVDLNSGTAEVMPVGEAGVRLGSRPVTRVALTRMRPAANGYRLHQDVTMT